LKLRKDLRRCFQFLGFEIMSKTSVTLWTVTVTTDLSGFNNIFVRAAHNSPSLSFYFLFSASLPLINVGTQTSANKSTSAVSGKKVKVMLYP
jgi:hypothetical protein